MADKSLNRDTSQLDPATWDHRWGYRDTELVVQPDECVVMTGSRYNLCGYPMPYLIPFVRQELGFDIDFKNTRPRTPEPYVSPVNRNEGFLAALPTILRDGQFSTDDRERLIHSHGQATTDEGVARTARSQGGGPDARGCRRHSRRRLRRAESRL